MKNTAPIIMDKTNKMLLTNIEIESTDIPMVIEDDNQTSAHTVKLICGYYNKGFCKSKEFCKKIHSSRICNKVKCRNKQCVDRHLVNCRYKEKCRRISECLYMHYKFNNIDKKLNDNEVMIKQLNDKVTELTIEINILKEENNTKQNDLFKLNNDNIEKDTLIQRLKENNNKITNDHKVILSSHGLKIKMSIARIKELEEINIKLKESIKERKLEKA